MITANGSIVTDAATLSSLAYRQAMLGSQAATYKDPILAKLDAMHTDQAMAQHDTAERLARIEEKVQRLTEFLERDSLAEEHRAHNPEVAGATPAPATIGLAIMKAIRETSR